MYNITRGKKMKKLGKKIIVCGLIFSAFLGAMTCFFIGGIVISFTYWYPMFTLIPLILVIECLILALGDFIDVYRKHAKTEKN